MKYKISLFLIFMMLYNLMISQNYENTKIDSLQNTAIKNPSKYNFKKLKQEIIKEHNYLKKDSAIINKVLFESYIKGVNYYENQVTDSAKMMLEFVGNKYQTIGLKINTIDYAILYSRLYNIYINNDVNKALNYLLLSIKNGSDDLEDLTTYYSFNSNVTKDSIYKMLQFSNINFLNNTKTTTGHVDLIFRYLTISDQLFRIDCSKRKIIRYTDVSKNDSILQSIFSSIILNIEGISILKNSNCQKTFNLILLHSVYNSNDYSFFEKHFHLFSEAFFNDFVNFSSISILMDNYLRYKYNKQFFGSEYGMESMPDGSRKLLNKINESDLLKIFNDLGIKNPKYK